MHPFEDSFYFDLTSVQHYRFVFITTLDGSFFRLVSDKNVFL